MLVPAVWDKGAGNGQTDLDHRVYDHPRPACRPRELKFLNLRWLACRLVPFD